MTRKELTTACRDYTINLHKSCHKTQFKKKAKKAMSFIRRFAMKNMMTKDVRIGVDVNQYVWGRGVRNIPRRVRVRMIRSRNEQDDQNEKFYTEVRLVKVRSFKKLLTENTRDN